MEERGPRPGGLTALAVINFVFAGLGALRVLGLCIILFALLGLLNSTSEVQEVVKTADITSGAVIISLILTLVAVVLLIVSGIGYLGQKKFLGRQLGTLYALVSLTNTVLWITMTNEDFNIGTIIGLIYPVLTLILVNTTFKDDLVR